MNSAQLTVLRGSLLAYEQGILVGLYGLADLADAVARWERIYPDMPDEERARVNVLKMSLSTGGENASGRPC